MAEMDEAVSRWRYAQRFGPRLKRLEESRKKREAWHAEHQVLYEAVVWPPHPGEDDEIDVWLASFTPGDRYELGSLLKERGTYSENQVLADWVLERGGRLWFRWATHPKAVWVKR